MSQLPNGLIAFGPEANCTLELCPLEASILHYRPNQGANGTFIGVFGLAMLLHTAQSLRTKSWGFTTSVVLGCAMEIAGYVGRLILHDNPFSFGGFLCQIICITVAPVFFCAAIYVLLSQIINHVDPTISRFKPQFYYWIFIPLDIVSLVLQAVGGALSCVATTQDDVQIGVDISLAGLCFQVVTLTAFCALFGDYMWSWTHSPARCKMTPRMRCFLAFFFASVLLILIRCAYRIAELREGYFSELFRDEPLFIALESCVMCVAVLTMIGANPGLVLNRSPEETNAKDFAGHEDVSMSEREAEGLGSRATN
ncbi:Efflux pump himE [Paramyrothecium foliicola]|nr:Efflux pump himE [Paramyrothecium foliicola]